jgi:phage shock protein PspC (stress-responsive transcriptional regulator)
MNTTESGSAQGSAATTRESDIRPAPPPPLRRPVQDRMLAGVASGIARHLGLDPMLVRIAIVVLCFVGGVGIALYLASWVLIPEEGSDESIASEFLRSMQGWRE